MDLVLSSPRFNGADVFDNERKLKRRLVEDKVVVDGCYMANLDGERGWNKRRRIVPEQIFVLTAGNLDDDDDEVNVSSQGLTRMKIGSCYLPKDNELKPLGEDAHFICREEQTLGVADGVGGWAARGVDAGEYARELMGNATIAVCEEHSQEGGSVDPRRVLNQAYLRTKAQGSSTACIVTLKAGFLHAVNVGDSGFMVFRDTKLVYHSPIQQRGFNRPYQLGNSEACDRPDMAMELSVRVKAGDVVVVATDGLFDNMYPSEIEEILKREIKQRQEEKEEEEEEEEGICGLCPDKVALLVAEYALYNSFDKSAFSPFAKAAKKAGLNRMGGKVDDITVVVGIIGASKVE